MNGSNSEYFKWILAVTAAVLWHLLLWMHLPASKAAPENYSPQKTPQLSYIQSIGGPAAGGDLMTPVLFSLPSSVGFSKSVSSYGVDIMRAVKRDVEEMALLENPLVGRKHPLLVWPRHMDRQVSSLLDNPVLNQPRRALAPSLEIKMKDDLHVRIVGVLAQRDLLFNDLDISLPPDGPAQWSMRIKMEFDSTGLPTGVFIVEPSGSAAIDRQALLSLNRWRLKPGQTSVDGEVILQSN